jgi:condensin complex subunit 1
LKSKFPKRRHAAAVLFVRHLQDKSSTVRKYVIRALTSLITTHPYSMYGGELDLEAWQSKLAKLKEELEVKKKKKKKLANFALIVILKCV